MAVDYYLSTCIIKERVYRPAIVSSAGIEFTMKSSIFFLLLLVVTFSTSESLFWDLLFGGAIDSSVDERLQQPIEEVTVETVNLGTEAGTSSIESQADVDGIIVRNDFGIRLLETARRRRRRLEDAQPAPRILFGPTDDCSIGVQGNGIEILDRFGLRVMVPEGMTEASPQLAFGPTDECRIRAVAGEGLFFDDPEGFVSARK